MNMSLGMVTRACSGALLVSLLSTPSGFAQRPARGHAQRPVTRTPEGTPQKPMGGPVYAPNRYMVFLSDAPVVAHIAPHARVDSAAASAYRQTIEAKQQSLMRELISRKMQVVDSVATVANAVFVVTTPDRLAELRSIPGVAGVMPERYVRPSLNKAVVAANGPNAWNQAAIGGQANAGKGIKIGIIDSGIDAGSVHTSPAFADTGFTAPSGFPKCNAQVPGSPSSDCGLYTNKKVIVARSYVSLNSAGTGSNPAADSLPDDYSARDRDGHGSAVAAAAAAVPVSAGAVSVPGATGSTVAFSGMAPAAFLGSYKVYGSPQVATYPPESVVIKALNDAVSDGMDVINFSGGAPAFAGALDDVKCGNAPGVPCDPLANAFELAAKNGKVITVASGNFGTDFAATFYYNSITSPGTAPSVITVGATVNSHLFGATVSVNASSAAANLKNIVAAPGDTYFYPGDFGANTAPLFDITQAPINDNGQACKALPAGSLADKFALIQVSSSSTCTNDVQAINAAAAGAVGIVFYMATSSTTVTFPDGICLDNATFACDFWGPTAMVSLADGQRLKTYIDANPGAKVTIDSAGSEQALPSTLTANSMAVYSSLGPAIDGTLKPDMVATGGLDPFYTFYFGSDNGLYTVGQSYDPNGNFYSSNGYIAANNAVIYPNYSGTSFSAPLVAGAAALVMQAHPTWSAAQVKSALVNNAAQDVTTDDFGDAVDVQEIGGGRLDANAAVAAKVTAVPSTLSYGYLTNKSTLPVTIPVTVTNTTSAAITLAVKVTPGPFGTTTATVTPDKTSLSIPANGTATLNLALTGSISAAGEFSGTVSLTSTSPVLVTTIPYMFLVGDGSSPSVAPLYDLIDWQYWGATFGYGQVNGDLGALPVQVIDSWGVPVAGATVSYTVTPSGSISLKPVTGLPFQPANCTPSTSTSTVNCTTNNYGIAWVEAFGGSTPATNYGDSVDIVVSGTDITHYVNLIPAMSLTSVTDAGAYGTTIAPGSYVSFFGSNLVDPANVNNPGFLFNTSSADAGFTNGRLPLTWGGVTVSFDAPASGNLPAISVPGYVYYISPTQVNAYTPWELENYPSANVKVTYFGAFTTNLMNVPINNYTPAFLMYNSGNVFIADAVDVTCPPPYIVGPSCPAGKGNLIQFYVNGLGPVTHQPASGDTAPSDINNLAETTTKPVVTIGGQQATVQFSGLAPGFVGLYQVNAFIPTNIGSGNQPITIAIGGKTSPTSITGGGTTYQIVLPIK